ncbi:MAG TPA: PEP-CTERM sorting domain-containing protein [Myxococcota bacterium]|nr:PEP-CTERM sorting domain-containing protein [Myxococcota bacterium]
MKFQICIFSAVLLCIAAVASASPRSDDEDAARGANGNGNGLGHAYGHLKKHDLAESAAPALKVPLFDLPRGGPKGPKHEHGPGDSPHGPGKIGGGPSWGHGPITRPPTGGDVAALPEPTGALLFGIGFGLVAALRRRR